MLPGVALTLWSPEWGMLLTAALLVVLLVVAFRNERDAFFNCARVHARQGLLGLRVVDVPLESIREVIVEPVQMFPGMGTIIVTYGVKYLQFECVPDAEGRAQQLREAIAAVQPKRRDHGAAQQSV